MPASHWYPVTSTGCELVAENLRSSSSAVMPIDGGMQSGANIAGAAGSPPGSQRRKAGTDHRTVVTDHGDGNTRRVPLWSAEEGMPREARKRRAACYLPSPVP